MKTRNSCNSSCQPITITVLNKQDPDNKPMRNKKCKAKPTSLKLKIKKFNYVLIFRKIKPKESKTMKSMMLLANKNFAYNHESYLSFYPSNYN